MGYELNKLMRQFGVSTPGVTPYVGPAAPGAEPVAPTMAAPVLPQNPSGKQTKAYNTALSQYNTAQDQYNKEKAAFDEMTQKYQDGMSQYNAYRDWETDRKSTRLNSSH